MPARAARQRKYRYNGSCAYPESPWLTPYVHVEAPGAGSLVAGRWIGHGLIVQVVGPRVGLSVRVM